MNTVLRWARHMMLVAAGLAVYGMAGAQGYPAKPVRLIVSGPAGGGADVIFRPVAQRLTEQLGQQVVVDNRPGAGSIIAAQQLMTAPADGYTVLQAGGSGFSIAPFAAKKQPYDPERDFTPITMVALAPLMITVHPAVPARSVSELVNLARGKQNRFLYASNGQASFSHLTTEYFNNTAGIAMTHVPYKGGTPAVIDTVAGHTQIVITAFPTLITQVKAARLRAIAVTSIKRTAALPDLPTVAESGYPGFEAVQWYGMFAPRGISPAIVERLYGELRKAGGSQSLKEPLAQEGAELAVAGPQALAEYLRADMAKWRKVIKQANIVLE